MSGCMSNDSPERDRVTERGREGAPEVEISGSGSIDVYIDAYGDSIPLVDAPRIISLAPNLTEIVYALGAGDRLLARTDYCDYPPEATTVESVGTLGSYGYERIVALEPDVVLMMTFDGSSKREYDRLKELGLRPVAFAEGDLAAVIATIDSVGHVVDAAGRAEELTRPMRRRLDSIARLRTTEEPVPVFIVIDQAPLMTVSGGFIGSMVEAAGGRNVAADNPVPYPRYSREALLIDRPEVILIPSLDTEAVTTFRERYPEVLETPAGGRGRIGTIEPNLLARPGPRILDGVVAIRRALRAAQSDRSPSD